MVRVEGEIKFMEDKGFLLDLIKGHEGMYTGKTEILEMFYMSSGNGEIFDLTEETPKRMHFILVDAEIKEATYQITNNCLCCGNCKDICLTGAIIEFETYYIDSYLCVNCGRCYENCTNKAIKFVE